jgi:hypothetical protein
MAYWPLDGDLLDASGNGHNAVFMVNDPNILDDIVPDTTVPYVTGKVGTAVVFDGQTQFAYTGTWNPSEGTNQLTVAFWAKWNGSAGHWEGPIGKRDSYANNNMMWQIEMNESGNDVLKTLQSEGGGGGAETVRLPEVGSDKVSAGGIKIDYSAQHTSNVD